MNIQVLSARGFILVVGVMMSGWLQTQAGTVSNECGPVIGDRGTTTNCMATTIQERTIACGSVNQDGSAGRGIDVSSRGYRALNLLAAYHPEGENDCSIAPNPSSGVSVLSVDLPRAGNVVVVFYGIDGSRVWSFPVGTRERGTTDILLDFRHVAGNLFLIEVELDGARCGTTTVIRK